MENENDESARAWIWGMIAAAVLFVGIAVFYTGPSPTASERQRTTEPTVDATGPSLCVRELAGNVRCYTELGEPITEDSPEWQCEIMGNLECGSK